MSTVVVTLTLVLLAFSGAQGALADGPRPAAEAPPITITGFSPTSGIVGTQVTITGAGFDVIDGVGFGGGDWAQFTHVSPTQVIATVPNTATGKVVVSASNYSPLIHVYSAANFVFTSPPRIDYVEPASAPAGTLVRVHGAYLDTATAVTYNGASVGFVAGFDLNQPSYSQVTVQVPAGAASGTFTVTTPGGNATSGVFTVVPAPTISGMTPSSGRVGSTVVLTGMNLGSVNQVTLNGATAGFTVGAGGTQVTVTVPSWGTTGPIALTSPGGMATSSTFTMIGDASVTPPSAAAAQPTSPPSAAATSPTPSSSSPPLTSSEHSKLLASALAKQASALTTTALSRRDAKGALTRIDVSLAAPRDHAGADVLAQVYGRVSAAKPLRWTTVGTVVLGRDAKAVLRVRTAAAMALLRSGAQIRLVDSDTLVVVAHGGVDLRA